MRAGASAARRHVKRSAPAPSSGGLRDGSRPVFRWLASFSRDCGVSAPAEFAYSTKAVKAFVQNQNAYCRGLAKILTAVFRVGYAAVAGRSAARGPKSSRIIARQNATEVHRARRRLARGPVRPRRAGRAGIAPARRPPLLRGQGLRNRHSGGQARPPFLAFQPGRQLVDAAARGHRARSHHLQTPLRADGWNDLRREPPRRGFHFQILDSDRLRRGWRPGRPARLFGPLVRGSSSALRNRRTSAHALLRDPSTRLTSKSH